MRTGVPPRAVTGEARLAAASDTADTPEDPGHTNIAVRGACAPNI